MKYFAVLSRTRLKHIPPLPQILDALLYAQTALFAPRRFTALDQVEGAVRTWPGVRAHTHRFGGTEFRRGDIEIGHLNGNGVLDLPFTPDLKCGLLAAGQAQNHHSFPRSGWVTFVIHSDRDVPAALSLLRLSYERHSSAARASNPQHTTGLV